MSQLRFDQYTDKWCHFHAKLVDQWQIIECQSLNRINKIYCISQNETNKKWISIKSAREKTIEIMYNFGRFGWFLKRSDIHSKIKSKIQDKTLAKWKKKEWKNSEEEEIKQKCLNITISMGNKKCRRKIENWFFLFVIVACCCSGCRQSTLEFAWHRVDDATTKPEDQKWIRNSFD